MDGRSKYTFNRRIRPKEEEKANSTGVDLPNEGIAFVYQRLSTHEQVRQSMFSLKMQDDLAQLAREDGYADHQIHVEKRDLGVSGTYGTEKREGLAYLIRMIEQDMVEAIYVVHTSRLYRDQTLIEGLTFGKLCKDHNVIIVLPNMRLNLNDRMHEIIFRMELDRAGEELEMMKIRMGGPRKLKARQGLYAGGPIAAGFMLDIDEGSPTYQKFIPYEPHAEIVRKLFELIVELNGSCRGVASRCRRNGIYFPRFGPEAEHMMGSKKRSSLRNCVRHKTGIGEDDFDGYVIGPKLVRNICTNPVYIGWWLWNGEVVSEDNHEPIVDEDLFWSAQKLLHSTRGKSKFRPEGALMLLEGILLCTNHDSPRNVRSSHPTDNLHRSYKCDADYTRGGEKSCFWVSAPIIDKPISDFVISQCSYPQYANRIIRDLSSEHEREKEKAAAFRRERARLTGEIENLKGNLALTKTPRQVEWIFEQIEQRMAERDELAKVEAYPVGRQLSAAEIETVKEFLSDLKSRWDDCPLQLRNEFLRLILDKVLIFHRENAFTCTIVWSGGLEQVIRIHRPKVRYRRSREWSEGELQTVREMYPAEPKSEILARLPKRTWIAVKHKAFAMKLERVVREPRPKSTRRRWTPEEDEWLRKYYSNEIDMHEMVERTGRTRSAVKSRGHLLGWKRKRVSGNGDLENIRWEVVDLGYDPESISGPLPG